MTILEAEQMHKVRTGKVRLAPMEPAPLRAGTNGEYAASQGEKLNRIPSGI
jgi:hypothetical protein